MNTPADTVALLRRLCAIALVVAIVGVVGSVAGAFIALVEFQRALLISLLYWIGASLGSLALLMTHHLTAGRWGFTVQRVLEAAVQPLPLLAALFLVFSPIALGLQELYPWADPAVVAADHAIADKSWYLNVEFFWIRFVLYMAVWIMLAQLLTRWSAHQDATGDARYGLRMRAMSGPGLLAYGLLASLASVDWMMSLTPHRFSSIYTLFFLVGHGLTALALSVGLVAVMARTSSWAEIVSRETFRRLGTLLLVFVLLWAYMAYAQYLVIWSGDLSHEIGWYVVRQRAGWRIVALVLVVIHLAVPFLVLVFRRTRENAAVLRWMCGLLVVARLVDLHWLITRTQSPDGFHVHWLDLATFAGVGGAWATIALGWLSNRPLLPTGDARLPHRNRTQRMQEMTHDR